MPGGFVQSASALTQTSSSPTTAVFPSAPSKGDLIVVALVLNGSPTVSSVTDTQGNTYTLAGSFPGFATYFAIASGGSGPNTVTVVWSGGSTLAAAAVEYAGPWPGVTAIVDNSAGVTNIATPMSYSLRRSQLSKNSIPDLVTTINLSQAGANWSGLSGTDRFGITGTSNEYNDFTQSSGTATITAAVSGGGSSIYSLSVSFFTITEPVLVGTYAIDDLLSITNDELHGKKNAFPETQKIRHLNKALDEIWKIMKLLKGGYWLTNNTPGLVLDTVNTDFILPSDFAEIRLIEVTNPVDYVGIDVIQMPMNTALFKAERQSFRAFQTVATADSVLAIPGQLNYDIYGPDISNQMHILFSRPAPVPLTLLIWYVRMVGHFSVPKLPSETLQSLMSPYVWNLCTYAAKSLLKSESTDQGEFAKWEEQWSKEIDRAMPAAHERATADEQSVEGFAEM